MKKLLALLALMIFALPTFAGGFYYIATTNSHYKGPLQNNTYGHSHYHTHNGNNTNHNHHHNRNRRPKTRVFSKAFWAKPNDPFRIQRKIQNEWLQIIQNHNYTTRNTQTTVFGPFNNEQQANHHQKQHNHMWTKGTNRQLLNLKFNYRNHRRNY